jgi:hypothetical protein
LAGEGDADLGLVVDDLFAGEVVDDAARVPVNGNGGVYSSVTGAPASWPTETPTARPRAIGMVTGSSPWPTGSPSMNSLAMPGAPLPLRGSGPPVGSNSKLRMWLPVGTSTSETTWKDCWAT